MIIRKKGNSEKDVNFKKGKRVKNLTETKKKRKKGRKKMKRKRSEFERKKEEIKTIKRKKVMCFFKKNILISSSTDTLSPIQRKRKKRTINRCGF